MKTPLADAAALLQAAKTVCALTGAGVSKESGVPTFRDAQTGLWAQYDPQVLATPGAFKENPKLVWDWYMWRRDLMADAQPNAGHDALAQLEKYFGALPVITQNVDDLHEQAGSHEVIHLHGNIAQDKCFFDCQGNPTLVDRTTLIWDKDNGPPTCPHCGRQSVRPNVVWFGELLPEKALQDAQALAHSVDVMLVIGTSGLVTPAASLPAHAKRAGAAIIEVNPDYSMITRYADVKLEGPSGEMLPKLLEALAGE